MAMPHLQNDTSPPLTQRGGFTQPGPDQPPAAAHCVHASIASQPLPTDITSTHAATISSSSLLHSFFSTSFPSSLLPFSFSSSPPLPSLFPMLQALGLGLSWKCRSMHLETLQQVSRETITRMHLNGKT
eukprot:TRINITY_DN6441_c11_g1_i1.p1 TRINITY_DN6441_c11_g1~~TRINITY_DN6441_c11_g1_i1.p1  ORF type:complete len:129 (+),score=22.82 TRINITY_DN6441_c11_g1_i1:191-577(+)